MVFFFYQTKKEINKSEFGEKLESEFGNRCFGIAANMDFLLICSYEENGENPELVIYKKR